MRILFSIALCLTTIPAAADIVQPANNGGGSFTALTAFGQSFTATASEPQVAAVSFQWSSVNLSFQDPTITARLRDGVGFTGSLLATQTIVSIPDITPDGAWIDFTFSSPVALTVGQSYSLQFTRDTGASSGGRKFASPQVYAGGTYLDETGSPLAAADLTFRVLSSAVPEPSGCLFGVVAFLVSALGCAWYRQQR